MKQKQIFIAKVSQNKKQTWIPQQLTTGLDKTPAQPSIKKPIIRRQAQLRRAIKRRRKI